MKMAGHDNTLETNAEVKSQNFGIGDASKIIEILRKHMYEHKIRTMVQEYMCNARDAAREVNSKKRIVVTLPNQLSPVFKVRDFGPGITPDRMANVFIQYGATTKSQTNKQTGGFGLGAKSAWAYTDSFTIVSITDGKKRTYVAHTGVNNQGRLDMISEVNTDEENGAEIHIAVKPYDLNEFKNCAFRACYFWDKKERPEFRGITAIDVEKDREEGIKIGNLELATKHLPSFLGLDSYSDRCVLIIDGIPYSVGRKLSEEVRSVVKITSVVKGTCLIHIGNGVVEVTSSRESISDSEFTRKNLAEITTKLHIDLVKYIKDEFKAVTNNGEWIKTYHKLERLVQVDEHSQYGAYKIERGMIESKLFPQISLVAVSVRSRGRAKGSIVRDTNRLLPLTGIDRIFVRDTEESLVIQNRRIREYLEKNLKDSAIVVDFKVIQPDKDAKGLDVPDTGLTEKESKKALAQIMKDFTVNKLSSLPFTPIVREPKAKVDRTKEMFTIHECGGGRKSPNTTTLGDVVSTKRKYVYINIKHYEKYATEFDEMYSFLFHRGLRPCALAEKSLVMVEGHANFIKYEDWKGSFKPDANIIKAAKSVKAKNFKAIRMLALADEKIKDKHVAKMIGEYKGVIENEMLPAPILKMVSDDLVSFVEDDKELTTLLGDSYPLLRRLEDLGFQRNVNKEMANELVAYINAKV